MHDGQVEDRLRAVLRAEGDALPLTITPDELERRLALRRRERLWQRASLAAAAVGVILVGSVLAASMGWLGTPGVGSGPSPVPRGTPEPSDVGSGPSPVPSATPAPSEDALPCDTIDPTTMDMPPGLAFGLFPGDSIAYGGALSAYRLGSREVGDPRSWELPASPALDQVRAGPPVERLDVLTSNPDACLQRAQAQAMLVAPTPRGRIDPTWINLSPVGPERGRVLSFTLPPAGEWLVRVHVEFSTTNGSEAWSETFFRVQVYDPSADWVTNSLPSIAVREGTVLLEGATESDRPEAFTDQMEETVVGQVPPRSQYKVDFVCLGYVPLRWSIGKPVGNEFGYLASGFQTCDGTPGTQTVTSGTPPADLDVIVEGDPAAVWRIVVSTPSDEPLLLAPALRMWATDNPDGAKVATEAFAHCVGTDQAADPCGPSWSTLDDRLNVLVPTGASVTFALQNGWRIDEARVVAIAAEDIRSGANGPEYSVAFVDTGGLQQTIPIALDPGEWIIQVALNATKDGVRFDAEYYLRLAVTQ